jgi:hypothetical protein
MEDLKGFREGVNGLGHYIRENDNLIDKQVKYLNAYIHTAAQATDSMGKHFDRADDAITQFVERRIQTLMEDSRKAAVQIEDYFACLREDNIHVKLARQIESLQAEVQKLGNGPEQRPNRPLTPASPSPPEVHNLKQPVPSRDFVNSIPFKVFVYMSGIFYTLGLTTLLGYLLSLLLRL